MVGDLLHGTEVHWGDLHGDRYVEASWLGQTGKIGIDLDLETSSWWWDPEVDMDFDLRYDAKCSADQSKIVVNVVTENLRTEVDYDWFAEFWSTVLPCAPVASVVGRRVIPDCISYLEGQIRQGHRGRLHPRSRSARASNCRQANKCLSPRWPSTRARTWT